MGIGESPTVQWFAVVEKMNTRHLGKEVPVEETIFHIDSILMS